MTDQKYAPSQHDSTVSGMFGAIAGTYDFFNRLLSLGIDIYWRHVLASAVRLGDTKRVLDLAAGTLDVSLAIRRKYPQATVPALDFCHPMLARGRRKLAGADGRSVLSVTADAKHLPLPDASVDCITIAFGIRNILPREECFAEMLRVLRPGGRVCILEFGSGRERIWRGLYNVYLTRILPRIGNCFSRNRTAYTYLAETICAFPPAVIFEDEMRNAGFVHTWYRKLTSGIVCLHVGEKPL